VGVNIFSAGTKGGDFDADELKKLVIREFANQFFTLEQVFVADVAGNTLKFQVIDLSVVDLKYVTGETNKKEGKALPFSLSHLFFVLHAISHLIFPAPFANMLLQIFAPGLLLIIALSWPAGRGV
jgi:hypothetical protein